MNRYGYNIDNNTQRKRRPIVYAVDSTSITTKNSYTIDIPTYRDVISIELIKAVVPNPDNDQYLILNITGLDAMHGNTSVLEGAFCTLERAATTASPIVYQRGNSDNNILYTYYFNQPSKLGRLGFFNARNGIFFEQSNGVYSFVIRNETVEERVVQSSWNKRSLENGATILDTSKAQIFWCDVEWLGAGSVMCGFIMNREMIGCHQFNHANSATSTYMKQAKLPIRYEITETGIITKKLKQICSSVLSEGGYEPRSIPRSIGNTALISVGSTPSTIYPLAIRQSASTINDIIVLPLTMDILAFSATASRVII